MQRWPRVCAGTQRFTRYAASEAEQTLFGRQQAAESHFVLVFSVGELVHGLAAPPWRQIDLDAALKAHRARVSCITIENWSL